MGEKRGDAPADANSEGSFIPVPAFNDGHLTSHVASWSMEDLVGMAVVGAGSVVGVVVGHCACWCFGGKL